MLVQSPESIFRRAQPGELSVVQSLGPLFVETSPFVLLGLAGVALLRATLSPSTIIAGAGSMVRQALRGVLLGLRMPECARKVPPMTARLVACGSPVAVTVGFLGMAPQLHPAGAALSLRLLGAPLTALLTSVGLTSAVLVALLVAGASRNARTGANDTVDAERSPDAPFSRTPRWRHAMFEACRSLVDHACASFLLGLVLAAIVEAGFAPGRLAASALPWRVLLCALLAVPASWCAPAAIPLALVLIHKGASIGGVVLFLAVATVSNRAVLATLRGQIGLRAAVVFGISTCAFAAAAGVVASALVPTDSVPDLHVLAAHRHTILEWASAVVLAALLVVRLLRTGPQGWLGGDRDAGRGDSCAAHSH